ncbi:hypothetical protein BDF14DRAFT_1731607, partial [Spinellus fusiger]
VDPVQRLCFLRDMNKTREALARFKGDIHGLEQDIQSMALAVVSLFICALEIGQDLTAAQEVNVNLQVLLEKSMTSQKEAEGHAAHTIKSLSSSLVNVVQQSHHLGGRVACIESRQHKQQRSIHKMNRNMKEYAEMLGQARNTLEMLQAGKRIDV